MTSHATIVSIYCTKRPFTGITTLKKKPISMILIGQRASTKSCNMISYTILGIEKKLHGCTEYNDGVHCRTKHL